MRTHLLFTSILFIFISCSKPPLVKGVKAKKTAVESTVSSVNSGTVKAEHVAELSFGAMGRVSKLNVRLGDSVEAKSILAELENDDLKTALMTAEKELKRQESLAKININSKTNFESAQMNYQMAKSQYERSLIRAPFSGIIAEVNLEEGQLSQTTAVVPVPPLRIVDTTPRYVDAQIDEVDIPKVKTGLPARVKILAIRREPFSGKVRKIVPYVSTIREQDRTSEIELSIENEGFSLPVGASADVEIIIDNQKDVLAVPARTILGHSEDRFVYRYIQGKAIKTPIIPGLKNYDRSQILQGINEEEIILFPSDSFDLTDGLTVTLEEIPWP